MAMPVDATIRSSVSTNFQPSSRATSCPVVVLPVPEKPVMNTLSLLSVRSDHSNSEQAGRDDLPA
jgi:hypothetical protein